LLAKVAAVFRSIGQRPLHTVFEYEHWANICNADSFLVLHNWQIWFAWPSCFTTVYVVHNLFWSISQQNILHLFSALTLSGFTTLPSVPLQEQYRCGFFVGGGFGLLVASYEEIRWTRRFTWFGPSEHNTLRPRVNGVVLLCLSARLRSSFFSPCVCLSRSFLAQGRAVTVRPHGPTGGPGAGRHLRS
jgi:hypothetical protein